jgi:putative transposase
LRHLNRIASPISPEKNRSRIPPNQLKKGCLKIAIDLNLICYYGKQTSEELEYIYRSQAKSGTHSFYAYATLVLVAF